jgi:hypothetical protein
MIGNFFNYLGTTAYKYGDQDRGRISYETATGYASSIKVYYTDKLSVLWMGTSSVLENIAGRIARRTI